jgi:MazG family protein
MGPRKPACYSRLNLRPSPEDRSPDPQRGSSGIGQTKPTLFITGLGPGPVDLLTLEAWELLASGRPLRVRDPWHEAAQTVLARGFQFQEVIESDPGALAGEIVGWAANLQSSVYAVPGNPLEAAETLPILERAAERNLNVKLVPGISDFERIPASDPLTRAHITPEALRAGQSFMRLVQVMARLRSPWGCPWDREQTHSSLAVHLLEETYEVLDCIDRNDLSQLQEEVGDLLIQVVFHSELAREARHFQIGAVIDKVLAKLFQRHPHVFGEAAASTAHEVVISWEALKRQEKQRTSVMDDIPRTLPALLYAYKIQRRLASDSDRGWGDEQPSADRSVAQAAPEDFDSTGEVAVAREEMIGELLFEIVAAARRLGVDPESALRKKAVAFAQAAEPR